MGAQDTNPLTWTNGRRKLADLIPWDDNPAQIGKAEAARLEQSLNDFGQVQTIAIEPDGKICDGHQRRSVWAASRKYGADYEVDVRIASRPLTEDERRKLAVFLRSGTVGQYDWDKLAAWDAGDLQAWGLNAETLRAWDDAAANLREMLTAESAESEESADYTESVVDYVPDAIFATDNEFDIPLLLPELQGGSLELPLTRWGEISRKSRMTGTYHFYTQDYKFDALWQDPENLINSRCAAIVEPNFSTNEQMPMAVILWGIYRKRWIARFAQGFGIKVWVDLNVTPKAAKLNLLGVPRGWKSFFTRGLDVMVDLLDSDYATACDVCGARPEFVVYGGGNATIERCKKRGWLYLPENIQVKEGRKGKEANYG